MTVYRGAAALLALTLLAGCGAGGSLGDMFKAKSADPAAAGESASADADTTGSIGLGPGAVLADGPDGPKNPELLGTDPKDDLSLGKMHYRQENFGRAEHYFRRAAELRPRDGEAWVGLAASYDRLKRFDLADRAYGQALKIVGPTAELLNNIGYSYMLRGDYVRARRELEKARAADPANPYVQNNMTLLNESAGKAKGIR